MPFASYWGNKIRSSCLRAALGILIAEVALVAVTWLIYQWASWLQRYPFSDLLFGVGALVIVFAGFGMLSRPYYDHDGPQRGVHSLPVQAQEAKTLEQMSAGYLRQHSLAVRLTVLGVLTMLLSVGLTWMID